MRAGIPQGGKILPILYSLYVNDIPKTHKTLLATSSGRRHESSTEKSHVLSKLQRILLRCGLVAGIPGLLHSVSRSSLLPALDFLYQFFSELPSEGTCFSESPIYAPLLTAEINHIQLIDRYFSPGWIQNSSRTVYSGICQERKPQRRSTKGLTLKFD
ncbi:hypothetical protein AVEN_11895-1 [Araneus ventricosus]|uniref:Uncharacterized protein n=1 Tax=Araneus ventricosus TaxID=182803 RepID=A0A4Y2ETB1_ARAVE|nr:hypothetical protein AVEN_11895-1 [Araneus ventricosus]